MGGLWDTIKQNSSTPRISANDESEVAIDPPRGAPIKAQRSPGLKFKPVESITMRNGNVIEFRGEDLSAIVGFENPNLDLVTPDVPVFSAILEIPREEQRSSTCTDGRSVYARSIAKAEAAKGKGRPRVHQTNAQRQKAYRDREAKKSK